MSVLSDEQYRQMARDAGLDLEPTRNMLVEVRGQHAQLINFARAVAEAAIAADRAARADREGQEPVAWIEFDGASVAYSTHKDAARRLPVGVRFDLYTTPAAAPVVPEGWRNAAEKGLLALNQAVNLNQLGWQEAELVRQGRAELSAMLAAAPAPSQDNGGAA